MRSSTSNSDVSRLKWLKIWLVAACVVLAFIASWEGALRLEGLEPEYSDNRALWLSARHRLSQQDETAIAILGASRVQRGIDVGVLSKRINRPVVQLAVEGSSGLPVLENLAADPRFRGTVIFSIAPAFSFNARLSKLDAGDQAGWVNAYMEQSRFRRMEQELRLAVQGTFAFRSADAAVPRVMASIFDRGKTPDSDSKTIYKNRFVGIDESKYETVVNQDSIVSMYRQNTKPYEQEGFTELLQYFGTLANILKSKGCRIFVLRLPSEGAVMDYEREAFPQERFWNEMRRHVDAQFIHFQDFPELSGYMSADGSHVATGKAREFTEQLASVLSAEGM